MSEHPDIAVIRKTIDREMQRQQLSRRALSVKAAIGPTAIRDILERTENPGIGTLYKIASALGLSFDELTGQPRVPLVGVIGAGGLVSYQSDDDGYTTVARPPNASGNVIALEVLGESMLPKYEAGDVIYIADDHVEPPCKQVGEYCAIRLPDGGTYLKMLSRGSEPDLFTLRSLNAADIQDVRIEWARPVLFIMPRRSRQF